MDGDQLGFDLGDQRPKGETVYFNPDEIRQDMMEILAIARSAVDAPPWDAQELRIQKISFPLLATWLPDEEERKQLCFEFAQEVERIELMMAA